MLYVLVCSPAAYTEGELIGDDISEQEEFMDAIYELELLLSGDEVPILLWDKKTVNKILALASIIGWTAVIAMIILCPPAGMAAALLAVLGLNISSFGMGFGLGVLCGVW